MKKKHVQLPALQSSTTAVTIERVPKGKRQGHAGYTERSRAKARNQLDKNNTGALPLSLLHKGQAGQEYTVNQAISKAKDEQETQHTHTAGTYRSHMAKNSTSTKPGGVDYTEQQ